MSRLTATAKLKAWKKLLRHVESCGGGLCSCIEELFFDDKITIEQNNYLEKRIGRVLKGYMWLPDALRHKNPARYSGMSSYDIRIAWIKRRIKTQRKRIKRANSLEP